MTTITRTTIAKLKLAKGGVSPSRRPPASFPQPFTQRGPLRLLLPDQKQAKSPARLQRRMSISRGGWWACHGGRKGGSVQLEWEAE
ncbi:hypothetical protein ATANTOWER_013994 [Ataeniobius toweri]|uniref:Uncharacterized protein n=1 Tax=Ataeniobius toweri TaxID=208326 RepID=A0ABU7BT72_9TELE|nr:hypothetical protein [Ataeniobius toweri]